MNMDACKAKNNEDNVNAQHVTLFYQDPASFRKTIGNYTLLKSFIVIGQNVERLDGIQKLRNLEDLWLVDCNLTQEVVWPLRDCVGLKRLFLYSNMLNSIPDLRNVEKLTHFWLSDNQIQSFKNVNNLTALEEFYISNNNIKEIDITFDSTLNIKCLNLSGNPISKITEIQKLSFLRKLRFLLMSDPLYKCSPVTKLANFRSYVVRTLPSLERLDSHAISPAERKRAIEFYETKLQYYRLTLHNVLATLNNTQNLTLKYQAKELDAIRLALHSFEKQDIKESDESNKVKYWECETNRWAEKTEMSFHQFAKLREVVTQQLELELEHCGNIKFKQMFLEENNMIDYFKKKFHSLMCPQLQEKVVDVNIFNIWSVQGPYQTTVLQSQFEDLFENVYILYPVEDLSTQSLKFVAEFLLRGYQEEKEMWMASCLSAADPLVSDPISVHHQLLLRSNSLLLSWRLLLLCGVPESAKQNQVRSPLHKFSSSAKCRRFSISNTSTVVPLYLVLYQYVFQDYFKPLKVSPSIPTNSSLNRSLPQIPNHKNITTLVLSCANIHRLDVPEMAHVTYVDLSYNHLQDLSAISAAFPKLTSLNLAFNKVHTLDSFQNMKDLTHLVLKWNLLTEFLSTLKKLKEFSSLKQLDLSWNPFTDIIRSDHQQCLLCRHLIHLEMYCGLPLHQSQASVQITLQGQNQFPRLPLQKDTIQPLTLRWKSESSGNENRDNHLVVIGNQIIGITLRGLKLAQFKSKLSLKKLKWLDLSDNFVSSFLILKKLSTLEEINLSHNLVESVTSPRERFKYLAKLDLSHNCLTSLTAFTSQSFPNLKSLDLSGNYLRSLSGLSGLKELEEVYLSNNQLQDCEELAYCRHCLKLAVIDLSFNPLTINPTFRQLCLYYVSSLKYINGSKVLSGESKSAMQLFGGKIDQEYLARMYSGLVLNNLSHLNLSNCSIKNVVLPNVSLVNVTAITLDHNELSSLNWVEAFPRLARLSLSHNHINCFSDQPSSVKPCLCLCSLLLDHNVIRNLMHMRLDLFPNLSTLVLNDNEITSLAGIGIKSKLERLVLDRNNICHIHLEETEKLQQLHELYIERNSLTNLDFICPLQKLKKLFVGYNKLITKSSLTPLGELSSLLELTVHGNPVCRQVHSYREYLPHIPSLRLLEGQPLLH